MVIEFAQKKIILGHFEKYYDEKNIELISMESKYNHCNCVSVGVRLRTFEEIIFLDTLFSW